LQSRLSCGDVGCNLLAHLRSDGHLLLLHPQAIGGRLEVGHGLLPGRLSRLHLLVGRSLGRVRSFGLALGGLRSFPGFLQPQLRCLHLFVARNLVLHVVRGRVP